MKYDALDNPSIKFSVCEDNLKVLESVVSRLGMELRRVAGLNTYAYLLLHARKAGKEEPRGTLHAHPYIVTNLINEPITYFFIHNGGIDKVGLSKSLGMSVEVNSVTDSYLVAQVLLNGWDGEDLKGFIRRFKEAIKYVKEGSALITATLTIKPSKKALIITSYVSKQASNFRRRYYRTYLIKGRDYIVITSSTIHDTAKDVVVFEESRPLNEDGEVVVINEELKQVSHTLST